MKDEYPVLAPVSEGYPKAEGRLLTCYSPVRRSSTPKGLSARLACVKHAASVRPEPGSNSPTKTCEKFPQHKEQLACCPCQRNPHQTQQRAWHGVQPLPFEWH